MEDRDWLSAAKALPFGGRDKIIHCGRDASLSISHTQKGYLAYCFRCEEHGFKPHGILSVADILQRKQVLSEVKSADIILPKDFTKSIPEQETGWLLRAGVPLSIAQHYGFGYSERWKRVILPIYKNRILIGFTSRSTIGEKPKYIARMKHGSTALFRASPDAMLPSRLAGGLAMRTLVVTEDILSAVRVGRLCRAVALLGTSTSDDKVAALLSETSRSRYERVGRVLLWLDGDRAGKDANASLERSLRLRGLEVSSIRTDKDPKRYSNREIRDILYRTIGDKP